MIIFDDNNNKKYTMRDTANKTITCNHAALHATQPYKTQCGNEVRLVIYIFALPT